MIRPLVDHREAARRDLSTLRTLAHGASPIGKAVPERAARVDRMKDMIITSSRVAPRRRSPAWAATAAATTRRRACPRARW